MRRSARSAVLAAAAAILAACSSGGSSGSSGGAPRQKAEAPTFSPAPLDFGAPLEVAIATVTSGATLRYTTDGSDPTAASTAYVGPVVIASTTTFRAIATRDDLEPSPVASATYTHRLVTLQLDDGVPDDTMYTSPGYAWRMLWVNRFTPAAEDLPFELRTVSMLFPSGMLGLPYRLAIYTDADGDPTSGATLRATHDVTVLQNDGTTWSTYALPEPVTVSGPGDVLIGLVALYADDTIQCTYMDTSYSGRSWIFAWYNVPPPDALPLPGEQSQLWTDFTMMLRATN